MKIEKIHKELKKEQEKRKVVLVSQEKKDYYGLEYILSLFSLEGEEIDNNKKNENVWWEISHDQKYTKLENSLHKGFLVYSSRGMIDVRIMDKYHHCELVAMSMIQKALDDNFIRRIIWLWVELKFFLYSEYKLWYKQILFKIKRKFTGDGELEKVLGKKVESLKIKK